MRRFDVAHYLGNLSFISLVCVGKNSAEIWMEVRGWVVRVAIFVVLGKHAQVNGLSRCFNYALSPIIIPSPGLVYCERRIHTEAFLEFVQKKEKKVRTC